MRLILSLAIGLAALLMQPAWAQPPLEFDYSFLDSLTLLRLEEVHNDLKLTPDQFAKVQEALKPVREKYVKQVPSLFKDEDVSKLEKFQEETKKHGLQAVEKVLKPEQFRRFTQLCIQQRSYKVFADKDIQGALKLTDAQLRQVPMLLGERDRTINNLKSFTPRDIERIDTETTAAHVNILTPEQKKQWEELVGRELKINHFGILQRLK